MRIPKKDINLKSTLLSGQSFRVKEEKDSEFTIVLEDRVVSLKEKGSAIIVKSNKNEDLKRVINEYLDLNRDYSKINEYLLKKDSSLYEIINYCRGYKILKQPKFEMLISYIISQNNTVKNISSSIEKISRKYGKKVIFNKIEYYLFPTFEQLSLASDEELRKCSVGFRSKYIINALNYIKKNKSFLEDLNNVSKETALESLMGIKGIGLKVASCILMFGYGRFDIYPIDTWVRKYFDNKSQKEILKETNSKYGEYSGIIIQYMFHYNRNKNVL